jgi:Rrf2 family transcriptional regulator, nitric oxide-sensitive transcriptional repressor
VLSQTVEYALRAVVQLAALSPKASTTAELAVVTQVPPAYLVKVLQALVKAGIVASQRGASGGVSLARPAEKLTILDIVNATDPIRRIRTCPLELATHGTNLCPLHRRLDAALAQVEHAFRSTTLAEVAGDPSKIKPLCETKTARGTTTTRRPRKKRRAISAVKRGET